MQSTVNSVTTIFSLDLAGGLTQVLADSSGTTNYVAYLYGLGRIGEEGALGWQYHLWDALVSVRQLTDASGAVTLAKGYQPYGDVLSSAGNAETPYGFTREWTYSYINLNISMGVVIKDELQNETDKTIYKVNINSLFDFCIVCLLHFRRF